MRLLWLLLVVSTLTEASEPAQARPIAPDRFIAQLLASRYGSGLETHRASRPAEAVFDRQLLRLMRGDPKTGEPRINFDPVCDCQDFELSGIETRLVASRGTTALVDVHFVNSGTPVAMRYTLRRKGDDWRIADIIYPGRGGLVSMLGGKPPVSPVTDPPPLPHKPPPQIKPASGLDGSA
jgi:hypothetical protein